MKILVCGSKSITKKEIVFDILNKEIEDKNGVTIIQGGESKGVEALTKLWAIAHMIPSYSYPVQYNKFGKSASFVRTKEMIYECDRTIVIWNGKSNGARADIELLKASGKPFKVYMPENAVKQKEKEKSIMKILVKDFLMQQIQTYGNKLKRGKLNG